MYKGVNPFCNTKAQQVNGSIAGDKKQSQTPTGFQQNTNKNSSITHLRLSIDVSSTLDQDLHHFSLTGEGGYVQSCVSFLGSMKTLKDN